MLSDIENLDIMLGENHYSRMREMRALIVIRLRDQEASQEMNLKTMVNITTWKQVVPTPVLVPIMAKNSTGDNSSAEINRLSSELNSNLSRELDDMMSSVNTQIQRAINDAISGQILPQIQSVLNAGS